jgi:DNA-binding CsgD family transcriptional regulator
MAKRNKETIMAGLLEHCSIRATAQALGVSESTIYNYLADAEFKREHQERKRLLFEENMLQLQALHREAIETISRNLHCEIAAVEVRAAAIIIEQTRKDFETADVLTRLEILEEQNDLKKQT